MPNSGLVRSTTPPARSRPRAGAPAPSAHPRRSCRVIGGSGTVVEVATRTPGIRSVLALLGSRHPGCAGAGSPRDRRRRGTRRSVVSRPGRPRSGRAAGRSDGTGGTRRPVREWCARRSSTARSATRQLNDAMPTSEVMSHTFTATSAWANRSSTRGTPGRRPSRDRARGEMFGACSRFHSVVASRSMTS